jgi:CheY-specific phosphatase CheX
MTVRLRSAADRQQDIGRVMTVVTRYANSFLEGEIGIAIIDRKYRFEEVQQLELKSMTSLVSVGGDINMLIAFSFDSQLIEFISKSLTSDIFVDDDERDLYMRETASEVINMIIGNSTADLATGTDMITLSPPVVIAGAKSVFRARGAKFFSVNMFSAQGNLDIDFVGPQELFDEKLNYIGLAEGAG